MKNCCLCILHKNLGILSKIIICFFGGRFHLMKSFEIEGKKIVEKK